ncbi:MAG: hypothetical protein WKG07_10995 [Hymenobacter sp.]
MPRNNSTNYLRVTGDFTNLATGYVWGGCGYQHPARQLHQPRQLRRWYQPDRVYHRCQPHADWQHDLLQPAKGGS